MNFDSLNSEQMNILFEKLVDYSAVIVPKILWALLVLWIGFKIVNMINRGVHKIMDKNHWDPMLESFLSSLISILLKVMVIISAAGIIWVQTSSFVAMLAAAGLAIGMALSGTLQNFAGWVMILMFKPYKIWDYIEAGGYSGSVSQIHIFNTILLTPDKKTIIIPNSDISNSAMTNYSSEPVRRLDMQVGISYSDDIDLAKDTLLELAKADSRVMQDKDITIVVDSLWDSAVIINFRFFLKSSDYWATKWEMTEKIKKTFDKKGLNFPFPQRDVHTYQAK